MAEIGRFLAGGESSFEEEECVLVGILVVADDCERVNSDCQTCSSTSVIASVAACFVGVDFACTPFTFGLMALFTFRSDGGASCFCSTFATFEGNEAGCFCAGKELEPLGVVD